ncbi:MAG TPA: sensor histidine kinase [Hellea balneolensis]|uniref:histidine kinase n=1 Tax=Hellea balneolensis TaxID=287478 RepID=A0A7C5LUT0_9PROT|nr:sensor histidine kinase [Hellea balneolensis]
MSLVVRLVRSAAMWVVPALLITGLAMIWFYRSSTYRIFDEPLVSTIQALIASVEVDPATDELVLASEPIDPKYQLALSGRYWLIGKIDTDGHIAPILGSQSLYGANIVLPALDAQRVLDEQGEIIKSVSLGPDKEPLRLAAQALVFPDTDGEPVIIVAAADRRPAVQAVRQFSLIALGLFSVLALGLATAMFMQVRLGLKPLFDLRNRVVEIREGRARYITGQYPKEVKPLADELNTLIGHNREVVEYARTHVANLAHALKTPLAVLMNEVDTSESGLAKIVARQTKTMSKQVEHHLRRARAAARGQAIGEVTPILNTVDSLTRTLKRIYRDKDLDIRLDIGKNLYFRGEKRDLEEMVGNLLDNACKWTKSRVYLSSHITDEAGKMLRLRIEDDGPGLKESEYAHVLKRGIRLDETTPGTGFGLAIVNDLAIAYKGSLVLGQSDLGGLRVDLFVPYVEGESQGDG